MWIGPGPINQWSSDDFHKCLDGSLAEDIEWAEAHEMTMAEFRSAYLLTLLGVISPAGTA